MNRKGLILVSLVAVLLLLSVSSVSAEVPPITTPMNPVTPSTNYLNSTKGWAYFDVLSKGLGTANLNLISTRNFFSCFEYRTDGDTSQIVTENGGVNYNTSILDGLYPYICARNNTRPLAISANEYFEIRMVFGAERDERFDWTRIDVPQCAITAPATVFEGRDFTATVECNVGTDQVYGFQFGTALTGEAVPKAGTFDPGSFVDNVPSAQIYAVGNDFTAYSASRLDPAPAATGNFSLASNGFTANQGFSQNKSATFTLDPLMLGDYLGANLNTPFASTTTVTIVDLWSLHLTVKSDGSVTQVRDVTAIVDGLSPDSSTPSSSPPSVTFFYDDKFENHTLMVRAAMTSHLYCNGNVTLPESVTTKTIELDAGDVTNTGVTDRIDNEDAVLIGASFGATTTGAVDVNGDGTVNILDLIHVGRNFNHIPQPCWS